jgi:hypothetical protein
MYIWPWAPWNMMVGSFLLTWYRARVSLLLSLSPTDPAAAGVARRRRAAGAVSGRRPVARATRRPPSPPRPVVASAVGARPSGLRPSRPARPCACSARRGPLAPAPAPPSGLCSIRPRLLSPPRFQPSASIWPEPVAAPAGGDILKKKLHGCCPFSSCCAAPERHL